MYLKYLKHILEHKKNVFIECWKKELYTHAFTHDLSKFSMKEFIPYAKWFNGEFGVNWNGGTCQRWEFAEHNKAKKEFDEAWQRHFVTNKHHWEYWCYDIDKYCPEDPISPRLDELKLDTPKDMPLNYIKQMICDWKAMGRKFGGSAQKYYLQHYSDFELSCKTRLDLEFLLGLNFSIGYNSPHTIGELAKIYDEAQFNRHFGWIKRKYNIDAYDTLNRK